MSERVAIVGVKQSRYQAEKKSQHLTELVYEVVNGLFAGLGITPAGVDTIASCSQDFIDGRTISNRTIPEVEGAYLKSEAKVAGDGSMAVFFGMMRILSGKYRTCLVLAHAKMSEGAQNVIANAQFDPFYQQALGLDELNAGALQARRYLHRYKLAESLLAEAAAKALSIAAQNPLAFRGRETTPAEVLASPMLASPIRELMAFAPADGCAALLLANESVAAQFTDKPVWIAGAGQAVDAYYLGDRDLSEVKALQGAARKAYQMAGIKDPRQELDLVELTDFYSYQELMWMEGLNLCKRGKAGEMLSRGQTAMDGEIPVNPSGGVLGGNPLCVAGLARVIECFLQIRGEAGEHQLPKPVQTAAAQGCYGPAGQSQCVIVLKSD
jgi:acetyl-CoA C-acetyltransferase